MRRPLTDERVAELARELREERRLVGSIRHISEVVADYYGTDLETLATGRSSEACEARYFATWLATEKHPHTAVRRIGRIVGYKDRTGPYHALGVLEARLEEDVHLREVLAELRLLVAA